jgi:hypothetical protein
MKYLDAAKPYFAPVIILSLLLPFVTAFIFQVNRIHSPIGSPDNIIRGAVLGAALLFAVIDRKKFPLRAAAPFLVPALVMLAVLLIHYLVSPGTGAFLVKAKKELVRLSALIFYMVAVAYYSRSRVNWYFLVRALVVMGLVLAPLAIHHAFTGETASMDQTVGKYLRAGFGIVGTAPLAAVLNLCSLAGLAIFFLEGKKPLSWAGLVAVAVMQYARMLTFSTAGYISIAVSVAVILFLFWRKVPELFLRATVISFMGVLVMSLYFFMTPSGKTVSHRLRMADDQVKAVSIDTRVNQAQGYLEEVKREPVKLLTGFGTGKLPEIMPNNEDPHNAFIRSLAVGGVVQLAAFSTLCFLALASFWRSVSSPDRQHRILAIVFLAATAGRLVQSLTTPHDLHISLWCFFLVALSWNVWSRWEEEGRPLEST